MTAPALRAIAVTGPAALDRTAQRFLGILLLASIGPTVAFAIASGPLQGNRTALAATSALWIASLAHVGMSGMFWLDRRYRAYMAREPGRYYLRPLILAIASVCIVSVLGGVGLSAFNIWFSMWLYYHFMRQNWGVLCLAGTATKTGRPPQIELAGLYVGLLGGVIGVLSIPGEAAYGFVTTGMISVEAFATIRVAGLALTVTAGVVGVAVAIWRIIGRAHPYQAALSVMAGIYFLPIYLIDEGSLAIGCTHAYQYAIIMTILASDSDQGSRSLRLAGLATVTGIYMGLYYLLRAPDIWGWAARPMVVLGTAVIMWHFMIDAGLWRLGKEFQRNAIRQSFAFLFR